MKQSLNEAIVGAFSNYLNKSKATDEISHIKKEPKFYVSDMGKCLRMRWLKRKGIKGEYDWETYYTFAHGDFIHTLGYKALEAKGMLVSTEQSFGDEHFSGRYDGVLRHDGKQHLFDFKSTNPYVQKRLVSGQSDNLENIMQVLFGVMFEMPKQPDLSEVGAVVYVNKLPSDKIEPTIIHTKEYHLSIYKKQIEEDRDKIVDYWNSNKIPPCTCPSWSMQKYNSYYQLCHADEKTIKKYLDFLKAGKMVITNSEEVVVKDVDKGGE